MKIAFEVPINSVSFGQLSILLLNSIYEKEKSGDKSLETYIFPIGNPDLSANDKLPKDFTNWLNNKIVASLVNYKREIPVFKLWHLNGSIQSVSHKQTILSFYELDKPTPIELNITKNNNTLFSSEYTCDIFKAFGIQCNYLPLAFDSYSFNRLEKKYHNDGRVVFNVCGKFEKRKAHVKVIRSWIKKYGNNPKFTLQCAIYNPFLKNEDNQKVIAHILENKPKPFNVQFFSSFKENTGYNDFLNSADVIIAMSGSEGWGLPEFHSVAMGKHAVTLNAHGYKGWANEENSVLVNPNGKISAIDGMFFREGDIYNQGNIFDWNEDDFINGCEMAVKRHQANSINVNGLKLQESFSKEKFLQNVIDSTVGCTIAN